MVWSAVESAFGPGAGAELDKPFVLCRWTNSHVLKTSPISGLAAMALVVPGSTSSRVIVTAGVTAAKCFAGTLANVRSEDLELSGAADRFAVDAQLIDALNEGQFLITTREEWLGSRQDRSEFPVPERVFDLGLTELLPA